MRRIATIFFLFNAFLLWRGDSCLLMAEVGVQVLVGEVTDTPTTGQFHQSCEVTLKFMGDTVADSFGVREVHVLKAIDDTGRDLLSDKQQVFSFFSPNEKGRNILEKKVALKNPSRSAKAIQQLTGRAELFYPSTENGGKVVAKGFLERPGEFIEAPSMAKWKVKMMYATKEVVEARRKELAAEREETKQFEQAGEDFLNAFANLFGTMFSGFWSDKPSLRFLVEDPEKRLVYLEFLDAQGKPLKGAGHSIGQGLHVYAFEQQPSPHTQLVIYLATPEAISEVPFELQDVPLP